MNKIIISSLSLLLASGCAVVALVKPDPLKAPKNITWERVSQERLEKLCNASGHYKNGFYGCTLWSPVSNDCKVYTTYQLKPNSSQEQYVLGHEVMHCFNGNYHQ